MRISHPSTITHLRLTILAATLLGCAPEEDLIRTGVNPLPPAVRITPPSRLLSDEVTTAESGEEAPASVVPLAFVGNAPNPFNPATKLSFVVPDGGGSVDLAIHGVDGRRARRLVATDLVGGEHSVTWHGRDDDGRRLPSGVYFACLRCGEEVRVWKMVLVQ